MSTDRPDTPATDAVTDPRKDSLIEYPSQFPIKVMGAKVDGFVHAITQIAERFDPTFDPPPSSCATARPATTSA